MNDVAAPKKAHLWSKGQSGNPSGRPKGSKNAISLIKLQVEGELRAQMKGDMQKVVQTMMNMALAGDADMCKTLFKSWVSNTRASEEEETREKIQIVIGKLDQVPAINGKTFKQSEE